MLEELVIKNYALIEHVHLHFGLGFNVLTGETGAGKSILIDALSLILGEKVSSDKIRDGADQAEVSAILRVELSPELKEWIEKYQIEPEDNILHLRRILRPKGRSLASIQNIPVTRTALSELSTSLVDIHGQHEHQSLFKVSTHRKLLDRFAGIEEGVALFKDRFSQLSQIEKELTIFNKEEEQQIREAEFLRYTLEEIKASELHSGEEEDLVKKQNLLARHEELVLYIEQILDNTLEVRQGALMQLRKAGEALDQVKDIDNTFLEKKERLDAVFFELEDIIGDLRQNYEAAEFNAHELENVDNRLAEISSLERKYKLSTIQALLDYAEEAKKKLEHYENRDKNQQQLAEKRESLQNELKNIALEISKMRRKAVEGLQSKSEAHLMALGMQKADFVIALKKNKNLDGKAVIGPYGMETVEFLLSPNQGEPAKPLSAVASGGEISRVMLALKTVLSESDRVQTLIFDEVDNGIGGEIARSVGEHLHALSLKKQVFCITHLASIAVFADTHLQVQKDRKEARTVTRVHPVIGQSRVKEIARMLAGDSNDSASLDHAARLLDERAGLTDAVRVG